MARGDGRLSHDLLPGEKGPQDACGVFGVWAPGEDVAKLTYFGLYALQHRGQESAGIATGDGEKILVYKDMGLVSQVFDETALSSLRGPPRDRAHPLLDDRRLDVGERPAHARGHRPQHARARAQRQPHQHRRAQGPRRRALRQRPRHRRARPRQHLRHGARHDAARRPTRTARPSRPPSSCCPSSRAPSPSSSWTSTRCMPPATRGACVPSRSAASSAAGSSPPRPLRCRRSAPPSSARSSRASSSPSTRTACARTASPRPQPKGCVFEYVYLARPDAVIRGRVVHEARVEMGAGARPRARRRRRPRHRCARVGRACGSGVFAGVGHPLRSGLRQERLRRPHLHPAVADAAPARHPAQAQPARAHDPRQAPRRRRRLDRARQHPARPDPHAARVRRGRGARAHQLAARAVAVLLRHRLRDARRARRDRPQGRGDPGLDRRRLARLHLRGGHDRRDEPAAPTSSARPASPAATRSSCPRTATSASTCSRPCR